MDILGSDNADDADDPVDPADVENADPDADFPTNEGWESDPYEAEMHVPFTRKTAEFGFLNGDSKTITYDIDIPTVTNPTRDKVGEVTHRHYYQLGDTAHHDHPRHQSLPRIRLRTAATPELTVVPANQTYKQVQAEVDMVAVVTATVEDIYFHDATTAFWRLCSVESVDAVPRDEVADPRKDYPTSGILE